MHERISAERCEKMLISQKVSKKDIEKIIPYSKSTINFALDKYIFEIFVVFSFFLV